MKQELYLGAIGVDFKQRNLTFSNDCVCWMRASMMVCECK